jgi:hypothetical protein
MEVWNRRGGGSVKKRDVVKGDGENGTLRYQPPVELHNQQILNL